MLPRMILCYAAGCATAAMAAAVLTAQPPPPAEVAMQDWLTQIPEEVQPPAVEQPMGAEPGPERKPLFPFLGQPGPGAAASVQAPMVRVTRTDRRVERTQDPIWDVELVINGQTVQRYEAVIGRANKQAVNRHVAGTEAPLPEGRYRIDLGGIAGGPYDNPELGSGLWIPVTPQFATGRSALGFHQDPSWGLLNGESGTSGCIGFKTAQETRLVADWIQRHQAKTLVVTN
jgi:hypothetical protein